MWAECNHDVWVWHKSHAKLLLEIEQDFITPADSAYPILHIILKSFHALEQSPSHFSHSKPIPLESGNAYFQLLREALLHRSRMLSLSPKHVLSFKIWPQHSRKMMMTSWPPLSPASRALDQRRGSLCWSCAQAEGEVYRNVLVQQYFSKW